MPNGSCRRIWLIVEVSTFSASREATCLILTRANTTPSSLPREDSSHRRILQCLPVLLLLGKKGKKGKKRNKRKETAPNLLILALIVAPYVDRMTVLRGRWSAKSTISFCYLGLPKTSSHGSLFRFDPSTTCSAIAKLILSTMSCCGMRLWVSSFSSPAYNVYMQ